MKLQIHGINNRYAFAIGKFSSISHYVVCPNIKPTYQYAWEAYRDAKKLYTNQYSHIEVINKHAADDLAISDMSASSEISAEDMIFNHYSSLFELMVNRCKSFKSDKDKEIVYNEIKAVVTGILKVKESLDKPSDKKKIEDVLSGFRKLVHEKFSKLLAKDKKEMEESKKEKDLLDAAPPTQDAAPSAPSDPNAPPIEPPSDESSGLPMLPVAQVDAIMKYACNINDIRTEIIDEYAERLCKCIEKLHPDSICKIDYDGGVIKMSGDNPILRMGIDDNLNVFDIEPEGELSKSHPLHSLEFYQRYWKPITEKIGHCLLKDVGVLVCPAKSSLPNIPNSFPNIVEINGWDVKESSEKPFEIHFCGNEPTWMIKRVTIKKEAAVKIHPSKYTEDDFIKGQPKRVECIDQNLKSIYGKTGEVIKVIPLHDHIELDINFGRLVVRLTENQIKIIDEIPNNK